MADLLADCVSAGHAGYCGADDPDADRLFQHDRAAFPAAAGKKLVSYVHYAQIPSQQNISEAFVLAVVFVIPVFLAYLLLQDYLIEGISHTAPGRIK